MKKILYILLYLIFICCDSQSAQVLWDEAHVFRSKNKLKDSIINLENIIMKYPKHELAAEAQYQIAEIYLNDIKNFDISIEKYQKVISKYPSNKVAKNSLFMIAYIYNNFLGSYTDAINTYKLFLSKYPDDELISSVEYELEGLSDIEDSIDSLKQIVRKKEAF